MSDDPFASNGIDWETFDPDAAVVSARGRDALTPASRTLFFSANNRNAKRAKTTSVVAVSPSTDWSALPSDLILRIGQLQDDPRSLASMERTCTSWRRVVAKGNDSLSTHLGMPCLWRDLALTEHPGLYSIAEVVVDESESIEETSSNNFTWKSLFRLHQHKVPKSNGRRPLYQPKTQMRDYIFTVEFRSADKFLFSTSARGMYFSVLWDQLIGDSSDERYWFSCDEDLDPELEMRLGNEPFSKKQLNEMTARVLATRLSDMALVVLVPSVPIEQYNLKECGRIEFECESLPTDRTIINEDEVDSMRGYLTVSKYSLDLSIVLDPRNGRVSMAIDRVNQSGGCDHSRLFPSDILMYLEVQCPWVKKR